MLARAATCRSCFPHRGTALTGNEAKVTCRCNLRAQLPAVTQVAARRQEYFVWNNRRPSLACVHALAFAART